MKAPGPCPVQMPTKFREYSQWPTPQDFNVKVIYEEAIAPEATLLQIRLAALVLKLWTNRLLIRREESGVPACDRTTEVIAWAKETYYWLRGLELEKEAQHAGLA